MKGVGREKDKSQDGNPLSFCDEYHGAKERKVLFDISGETRVYGP
jgi:hypothetical protein